jgi:hypothetical protein
LLLGLAISMGCIGISGEELRATAIAEVWQTVQVEIEAGVAATMIACPAKVALRSFHGRWVTALGEEDGWVLWQETELSPCGQFTRHCLADGKIALQTCHGRYVTAPESGPGRWDWVLGQELELDRCGQFVLHDLGGGEVAIETCAGRFWTAGDGNWSSGLEWAVMAETTDLLDWERFTLLPP